MPSTALVGPLKDVVRFHDGTVVPYVPPRDTMDDNRWRACTDHRVACDCREAEFAERTDELWSELKDAQDAARDILAGHATYAWETGDDGKEREIGCMCTGCRIARRAHLLASYEAGPWARDQTAATPDGGGPR